MDRPTTNLQGRHTLLRWAIPALLLLLAPAAPAGVVTYIDLFDVPDQIVATNNATVSNTVASVGAIGGYRTLTLTTSGGNPFFGPVILGIDSSAQELLLNTPSSATSFYDVTWGGVGGTAGLGGVDLTGGATNFTLNNSFLNFTLSFSDQPNNFTWTVTDTSSNVASYTASFPTLISPNPAIAYAVSLASFSGAGTVDWTSINFISLSGGGPISLDLTLASPITLAAGIPEPGTWATAALLLGGAAYTVWRRRKNSATPAPAAA
jgi:hypothetical protein